MSLEQVIELMKEKGFTKQAVLLEHPTTRRNYLRCLLMPSWKSSVQQRLGKKIYRMLQHEDKETALAYAIFGLSRSEERARKASESPLGITLESHFGIETLEKAAVIEEKLCTLASEADRIILQEALAILLTQEDLLYDAFKDTDKTAFLQTDEGKRRSFQSYQRLVQGRADRMEVVFGYKNEDIISHEIQYLSEWIPDYHYDDSRSITENAQLLIAHARLILSNRSGLKTQFEKYIGQLEATKRERILKEGKEALEFSLAEIDDTFSNLCLNEEGIKTLIDIIQSDANKRDDPSVLPSDKSTKEGLLKIPLPLKAKFLEYYQDKISNYQKTLVGIQQILEGGPITNPHASPVSILQNHNQYPNIHYSDETKKALRALAGQMKFCFDKLPDISDLATPTKLRNKKNLTYIMEEMPKDPLDVTFGNDSGCCIFVPDSVDQLKTFVVPLFILDPTIRLFSLSYVLEEKKRRIGFVLSFETTCKASDTSEDGLYLSCNSIELSRFGIPGGNATLKQLVDYAEQWLISYGSQFGYHGVTMGSHDYNTSVNYTQHLGNKVTHPLFFRPPGKAFYSDIFAFDPQRKLMKTRPDSCYWLWKR